MTTSIIPSDGSASFDGDMSGQPITNLADPTNPQDAATRAFVLANAGGGGVTFHTKGTADLVSAGGVDIKVVLASPVAGTINAYEFDFTGSTIDPAGSVYIELPTLSGLAGTVIILYRIDDNDAGTNGNAMIVTATGEKIDNNVKDQATSSYGGLQPIAPTNIGPKYTLLAGTTSWIVTAKANALP